MFFPPPLPPPSSHLSNSFPYVWPIKFLRFVVSVVLDAFYISALK